MYRNRARPYLKKIHPGPPRGPAGLARARAWAAGLKMLKQTSFFHGFLYTGNSPATRRRLPGTDNSALAEDLHNKNPSLTLSGKSCLRR